MSSDIIRSGQRASGAASKARLQPVQQGGAAAGDSLRARNEAAGVAGRWSWRQA